MGLRILQNMISPSGPLHPAGHALEGAMNHQDSAGYSSTFNLGLSCIQQGQSRGPGDGGHLRVVGDTDIPQDVAAAGFSFEENGASLYFQDATFISPDGRRIPLLYLSKTGLSDMDMSLFRTHPGDSPTVCLLGIQPQEVPLNSNVRTAPVHFGTVVVVTVGAEKYHFGIQPQQIEGSKYPRFTFLRAGQVLAGAMNGRNLLVDKAKRVLLHPLFDMTHSQSNDARTHVFGGSRNQIAPEHQVYNYPTRGMVPDELYITGKRETGFSIGATASGFLWIRRPDLGSYWTPVETGTSTDLRMYNAPKMRDRLRIADLTTRVSSDFKITIPYRLSEQNDTPMVAPDFPDEISINGTTYLQIYGTAHDPRLVYMRRPMDASVTLWEVSRTNETILEPGYVPFRPGNLLAISKGAGFQKASFFQVCQNQSGGLQFRLATEDELPDRFKGAADRVAAVIQPDDAEAPATSLLGPPAMIPADRAPINPRFKAPLENTTVDSAASWPHMPPPPHGLTLAEENRWHLPNWLFDFIQAIKDAISAFSASWKRIQESKSKKG